MNDGKTPDVTASDLNAIVMNLQRALKTLNPEKRLALFARITEGYCPHCGCDDPQGRCQCWNDE